MLSTSEFAAAIGVSESSVRRLADSGELHIHRTRGGHRRIPAAEAVRYVRENNATIVRPDLLGLVDGIATSDDYLLEASDAADIFEVKLATKQSMAQKMTEFFAASVDEIISRISSRMT